MIRLTFALLVACAPKPTDTTGSNPPPTAEEGGVEPAAEEGGVEPAPEEGGSSDAECTKEECGPAMGMPNSTCPDGKTIAGPACQRNAEGKCGYVVIECPE